MTVICKTKYLEFKSTKAPSGKDWYYVRRTNDTTNHDSAVVITTLVKIGNEYNYLLLKTNRPPLSSENKAKYCLESAAGLIGDNDSNENMLECAKKELMEECGLLADKMYIELTNCAASAGLSCETLSYVSAFVENYDIKNTPQDDGGIIIDRILVPQKEIYNYLQNIDKKEISIAAATVCGIFYAQERLNRLKGV